MILVIILAFAAGFVLFALVLRLAIQVRNAGWARILTPNGIDEASFVSIGGIEQWITVRGEDRRNPVLLILHGGPGAALSAVSYALFRRAERDFTIVHWDQRGAGRTFGRNGRAGSGVISIARMTVDGIEVGEHLCRRLGRSKIALCALSWGSILALGMLKARPDLFSAYVGTGQIVDMPRGEAFAYRTILARARRIFRRPAIAALEWIGPPPFGGGKARRIWQQWLLDFAPSSERRALRQMPLLLLGAPHTSLADVWDVIAGVWFSYSRLFDALVGFRTDAFAFDVPMFFFQGSDDLQTPTALVKDYLGRIAAPKKELVLLKGGGHMVIRTMGAEFLVELSGRVRALA